MRIHIEYVGTLQNVDVKNKSFINIDENSTIEDLLTFIKIKKMHQRFIIPFINGEKVYIKEHIKNNDKVSLFLPVGGG